MPLVAWANTSCSVLRAWGSRGSGLEVPEEEEEEEEEEVVVLADAVSVAPQATGT
jgi:hypothetical protein